MSQQVDMSEVATQLAKEGYTLHDWSAEDRLAFRTAAQKKWQEWCDKTPEARALVDSHVAYMKRLGILK